MSSLGNVGNIGGVVTSIILVLVIGVLALNFAPNLLVSANAMYLEGERAAEINGELVNRVVAQGTHTNADDAWAAASTALLLTTTGDNGAACPAQANLADSTSYYTSKGTLVTTGASKAAPDGCTIHTPSNSTTGIGGLWTLLIQVVGLVMMIGPIAFLSFMASSWISSANIGGAMSIGVIIGVVIGVVVIGETLSTLFDPLDTLVNYVSGPRLDMFQTGIGGIARTLSNFYVIGLAAGLIPLGQLFWRSRMGDSRMSGV